MTPEVMLKILREAVASLQVVTAVAPELAVASEMVPMAAVAMYPEMAGDGR